ncbi:alpha/beta fold hydrolase [Umezawaea tangerina]|uniref:Pimeloyl-ACP methyl ester carboxylesterase n=1 Tax=Umezawaea tangerina TaxID=84725 RepID=A0A2T0SM80_9PSEU|nr:alpha/beta fold hydrolase [Umezawaea tangerina]PRY34527.1 pimeloyl-ACP methyl ester carboxylesterase [Umezawaea tangerina]
MGRVLALVSVVALGLGSVTGVAGASAREPRWQGCGEHGAECATVEVPLDWGLPGGEKITLAVSRLSAADPARRIGVLFFNPGGPGGPAADLVRDVPDLFPRELRDRFDVVGVDPRGVGASTPAITCPVPPFDPAVSQFPDDRAGFDRLVAYNRSVASACREATGPLVDHVDTVSAARDFDVVREALGESRVSWLGLSYGTLLGATYAQLFPGRVRAAVLDGAVDHAIGSRRLALDEARVSEDLFARFAAWCAEDASCALHGRDVTAEYRRLLDRVPDFASRVGYGVYSGLSLRGQWPAVADLLVPAFAEPADVSAFAGVGSDAAYRVIGCHDFPSTVRGVADLVAREREIHRAAPVTRGYVEGWDVQAGCLGWPVRAANPWGALSVRGARQVLVVSGEHDPATPHEWGVGLSAQIRGSRLLTWSGVGHTAFFNDPDVLRQEVEHLVGR